MVEINANNERKLAVLTPNKSMSWETNKKVLWVMLVVNLAIGLSFAAIGAWLILPFAGLEILLVGIGMYYVCWKLNFQETIALENQELQLKKGVYYPKQIWQWQTANTSLISKPSSYRLSPPTLYLQHLNERVEVGQFLNRQEKIRLRNELQKWGIPVVTYRKR